MPHRIPLVLALAVGTLVPTAAATAQPAQGSVAIRLVDAPESRRDDPRARLYVVDHLAPGSTIRRRLEVSNTTGRRQRIELYAAGAELKNGSFTGFDGRAPNELSGWVTLDPGVVELPAGGRATATATIAVPPGVAGGERYAAIWAQLPPVGPGPDGGGVTLVNRVGIRVYLSVGGGKEPPSDFAIGSLTAARNAEGAPVVRARVTNTGQRALDMSGELRLAEGPGSLSAGPFPAKLGTTLAVQATDDVEVVLDRQLPAGPWKAGITLTSGRIQREATATITFPAADASSASAVKADPVEGRRSLLLPLALALVALLLLLLALAVKQRRDRRHAPTSAAEIRRAGGL